MKTSVSLFVTGTDTNIRKTFVCAGLTRALRALGRDAVAQKPIASGFEIGPHGLRNADLFSLATAADQVLAPEDLNVYAFEPAIAPHQAAALAGVEIELAPMQQAFARVQSRHQDVLVEGVGGFAVPFSATLMQADLIRALNLPVLLVVGVRLGCINHALLSAAAIGAAGLPLMGWVANHIDPNMEQMDASIHAIRSRLAAPLLGQIGHNADSRPFDDLARRLLGITVRN